MDCVILQFLVVLFVATIVCLSAIGVAELSDSLNRRVISLDQNDAGFYECGFRNDEPMFCYNSDLLRYIYVFLVLEIPVFCLLFLAIAC